MQKDMQNFDNKLQQVLADNKGKRITAFEYDGQKYWLKQTEQQKGAEKFLKPFPEKALKQEIRRLECLNSLGLPTATLVRSGEGYFVSTDVGDSINNVLHNPKLSNTKKHEIMMMASEKLAQMHLKDVVHGRPAVRDITYLNDQVYFIDFEAKSLFNGLQYQKKRDVIVFFYSMFQAKLDDTYVQTAMQAYAKNNPENWKKSLKLLSRLSFIYYIALLFKPVAKSDLISIIRLFEVVLDK